MIETCSKFNADGTWIPFNVAAFGQMRQLHHNWEIHNHPPITIRSVWLNGECYYRDPDVEDTAAQLKVLGEWATHEVEEEKTDDPAVRELQDAGIEGLTAAVEELLDSGELELPTLSEPNTEPTVHTEPVAEGADSMGDHIPEAAPLKLIDLEILK